MANQAKKDGWRIKAVLNNDMIGNIEGVNGVINNTTARLFAEGTRVTETDKEARMRRFTGVKLTRQAVTLPVTSIKLPISILRT